MDLINSSEKKQDYKSFNKNLFRCLLIIVCLLLIFIVIFYAFKDSSKVIDVELSENMTKNKSYDGLVITDIKAKKIKFKGKYEFHIIFSVKNNTNSDYKRKNTKIYFLDKNSNTIEKRDISIPLIDKNKLGYIDVAVSESVFSSDNFKLAD